MQRQRTRRQQQQHQQQQHAAEGIKYHPVYGVIIVLFIVGAYGQVNASVGSIQVYRLAQYDISGVPYGSRGASFKHTAVSSLFSPNSSHSLNDLRHNILIVELKELNRSFLQGYVNQEKPIGSLLILLPRIFNPEDSVTEDRPDINNAEEHLRNTLGEVERLLIHSNIPYPVYFGFEDETINDVLAHVKKNDATGQPATAEGGFKLKVSVPEPKKIESPSIINMQGFLPGLDRHVKELPVVAIVASYDTFGAAPALSVGSDSNGSGVVALLEIARLFSLLYSNPKTRGKYHLAFSLTSGGPYNYVGTQKWLQFLNPMVRDNIDYAICLNSIGSLGDELWIHVSKSPDNAHINHIFEDFSRVAAELGLKIGLKHKKINISHPRVAWEHEQFSRIRATAATLSGLPAAPELLERAGSITDNWRFVSEEAIKRSVKLVAETVARHIYSQEGKNIDIFADNSSLAVNPDYISAWLDLLSETPRVAPFLSKKDQFIEALQQELESNTLTDDLRVQYEDFGGVFTFYDSTTAKLKIYKILSIYKDFLLMLAVVLYLTILYALLVCITKGFDEFLNLFEGTHTD